MATASWSPKVSICVPVYNGAQYLQECLDSLIKQSFTDFEIVAVDDCSTDNSLIILQDYANRDRRIRVVCNPSNMGLVGNWNRCVELSRGEWIKFVFQDDTIVLECLERMLRAGSVNTSLLTICRREVVFESVPEDLRASFLKYIETKSIDEVFRGKTSISPSECCRAVLDHGLWNYFGEPTSTLIHRNAFNQYGLFNTHLIQLCDLEYWHRIGVNAGMIYVPETLAFFRVHGESATSKNASNRVYYQSVIDPLVMRCDYAYSPYYQALRDAAQTRGINLIQDYIDDLVQAQSEAIDVAYNHLSPDPSKLAAWSRVISEDSRLRMPWLFRIRNWGARMIRISFSWLNRYFFWRFRK